MKSPHTAISTVLAFGLFASASQAATVFAAADTEITESSPNADGTVAVSGGNGSGTSMNVRWSGDFVTPGPASANRNDMSVVRFDLSAYTLADLQGVTLSLTSFRAGTLNVYKLYGMAANATPTTGIYTASDWVDSAISFNTMPGVTFDALSTTQGLNLGQLTELSATTATSVLTRGQVVTFSSPSITSFINSYVGTSVTFLLAGNAEVTGQTRFATRQTTQLDTTAPAPPVVAAGTYAPSLDFTVVPEPSALLLTSLGGLALAFRRRM